MTDFLLLFWIIALTPSITEALAQQSPQEKSVALGSGPPSAGIVITSANASTNAHFLPPGADLAIKYGLTMHIVPTQRLDWSAGFTAETEKYSGQVGLDNDDYITN